MSRFRRSAIALLVIWTLTPSLAFGQAPKAGVVTTLEGNVTVTRVALPQPQPLKFKDDVFVNDKVTTGDKAIARMLLGGKAVVTVRERSSLTITEVPGKSTIDLDSGKIALAVAKDKMRPGESIEIRTQNAIAGVRGTVVVAEVSRATAQAPGGPPPTLVTTFYVLAGQIFGQQINVATGAPVGAPVPVATLQAFRASGISPAAVTNIPPGQVAQIVSGLSTTIKASAAAAADASAQANENTLNATVTLVNAITGQGAGSEAITGPVTQPVVETTETDNTPPILPGNEPVAPPTALSGLPQAAKEINAFVGTIPVLPASVPPLPINSPTLETFPAGATNWAGPGPYGRINNSTVSQSTVNAMMDVPFGSTVNLTGVGLLEVLGSTVNGSHALLHVGGTVNQTGATAPLVKINPSTVTSSNSASLFMIGGTLNITGPLLTSIGNTLTSAHGLVEVQGSVESTTTNPLIDLSGGSILLGADSETGRVVDVNGGSITTAGSLVRASGVTFLLTGDPFIRVASSVSAAGPLLDLTGTLNLFGAAVLSFAGPVTVSSGPAFRVNAGTLTAGSLATKTGGVGALTINDALLEVNGGGVHLGRLLNIPSAADLVATLPANTAFVRMNGGSLTTTLDQALMTIVSATQTGIGLSAIGATLTLAGGVARLAGGSTQDTNAGIQLTGANLTSTSVGSLVDVIANSTAKGPVLTMSGGSLTTTQDAVLAVNTGNFTINNALNPGLNGAALQFSGGTVSLGAEMAFVHPSRTLTLDRGLVSAVGTTITTGTNGAFSDPFFAVDGGGTVIVATSSPFASLQNASVTTQATEELFRIGNGVTTANVTMTGGGSVVALSGTSSLNIPATDVVKLNKANASISGPLFDFSGITLLMPTKTLLSVMNGTTAATTGGATAFRLTNSTVTVDKLVNSDGLGNVFNLAGPALSLTNSTLTLNALGDEPMASTDVMNFAPTAASLNVAFVSLGSSTVTVNQSGEHLVSLGDSSLPPTIHGVGFVSTGTAASPSTVHLKGSVLDLEALTSVATNAAVQLTHTNVNQTATTEGLIFVGGTGTKSLAASLLSASQSSLNLSAGVLHVDRGTLNATGSAALLNFVGTGVAAALNFVALGSLTSPAPTVTLAGPLIHAETAGSPVTLSSGSTRSFVAIFDGATVTSNAGNLLSLDGASGAALTINSSGSLVFLGTTAGALAAPTLTLTGSPSALVFAEHANLNSGTPGVNTFTNLFVGDGAILTKTGTAPLLHYVSSNVVTAGNIVTVRRSQTAALNSRLILGGQPLVLAENSTLTTINPGGLGGAACCSGVFVGQGGLLSSTNNVTALIQLVNSTWNSGSSGVSGGSFFTVDDTCTNCGDTYHLTTLQARVELAGGILSAVDSDLTALFHGLSIRRSLVTAGSAFSPVFKFVNSANRIYSFGGANPLSEGAALGGLLRITGEAGGNNAAATLTLNGRLLDTTNTGMGTRTTFNTNYDFIEVARGATLTSPFPGSSIVSSNATYNVGSAGDHRHFFVARFLGGAASNAPAQAFFNWPLIFSEDDIFNVTAGFLEASNGVGGTGPILIERTAASNNAFLHFDGSVVRLGPAAGGVADTGNLVDIRPNGAIALRGPAALAETTGVAGWNLDRLLIVDCVGGPACVTPGASPTPGLDSGGSTEPLFHFSGMPTSPHLVNVRMFDLRGAATANEVHEGNNLSLGTEKPLRHAGELFRGTDTSVSTAEVMRLDTALLEASKPLLHLRTAGGSGSTLTSANSPFNLANQAKVYAPLALGDAVVMLDKSVLMVTSGSVFNVGGASVLKIFGDLLSLRNGSTLNALTGGLATISGSSVMKVTGFLVNFGAGTNAVNLATACTGCAIQSIGGVNFGLRNGAVAGNINITGGYVPFNNVGGANTITAGAVHVIVDGAASKVKLGL